MADHRRSPQALSLHHLPDISPPDASVSFEIPLAINSADLLLADNSDFLRGVDCSLTTPPPPKRTLHAPLTLSELTPTPRVPATAVQTLSPSLRARNTTSPEIIRTRLSPQKTPQSIIRTRINTTKQVDSPVSAERLANLKAEVDSLAKDSAEVERPKPALSRSRTAKPPTARQKRVMKLRIDDELKTKTKATVADGAITKKGTRNKIPQSTFSRDLAVASRQHKPVGQIVIRPGRNLDKITTEETEISTAGEANTNVPTQDGAAERLVLLSQRLMTNGCFGFENLEDSEDDVCDIPAGEQDMSPSSSGPPSHSRHNDLFTLSQISPHKEDFNSTAVAPAPRSPALVRTGAKRPISSISDLSQQPRKKGKIAAAAPVRGSPKYGVPILQSSRKRLGPHIRQALALKAPTSRQPDDSHQQINNVGDQRTQGTPAVIEPGRSSVTKMTATPLAPSNPTKPIGFTFHSDVRLHTRKAGFDGKLSTSEAGKQTKLRNAPIPDFKSLHAAELQTSRAFRKEHIAPTMPITPELSTKFRAKEREQFDKVMRQKEEEMGRIKEARQKARQEEEDREIKELRKKAVPKAHEIPEWYADAPKKGGAVHS
ncbi:hypothetical protein PILCRDRAFT_785620 [Piloderma croceum F 1598]|uniref:TPX2 C-terminal domain-containing protein n=1 Tax=Piloderma croceum (strain F 1598) TaxID=765440 RepID=A0A0C3BXW9_PILCF|nr:hypothetical protein PILCRDRAFT_785620 [Piloderma croceum F 1598]